MCVHVCVSVCVRVCVCVSVCDVEGLYKSVCVCGGGLEGGPYGMCVLQSQKGEMEEVGPLYQE